MPDFNLEILHGDRDDAEKIFESCSTLPLGSDRKLVIVRRLEEYSEDSFRQIQNYCESPSPSTTLVLLWNVKLTQKMMINEDLIRQIEAMPGGWLIKCWPLTNDRRLDWIRTTAREKGKNILGDAAEFLSKEGGNSLNEIQSEMEKIFLFLGDKKTIEISDVKECMSFRRDQSVWDLANNLEQGKLQKAGQALEHCLEQGEDPIGLLNLMARSCRRMFSGSGERDREKRRKFALLFDKIKKADLSLKTGQGKESVIFEQLVRDFGSVPALPERNWKR